MPLWSSVSWTADAPSDSSIIVRVASSTDGVIFGPEQAVTNGGDPTVADDQYLKVSVSFQRATSGETPVLYDLDGYAQSTASSRPERPVCARYQGFGVRRGQGLQIRT